MLRRLKRAAPATTIGDSDSDTHCSLTPIWMRDLHESLRQRKEQDGGTNKVQSVSTIPMSTNIPNVVVTGAHKKRKLPGHSQITIVPAFGSFYQSPSSGYIGVDDNDGETIVGISAGSVVFHYGKWFYEIQIIRAGPCVLLGWSNPNTLHLKQGNATEGLSAGDVVGCAVDFTSGLVYVALNGEWESDSAEAHGLDMGAGVRPSLIIGGGTQVAVNFGDTVFSFLPPHPIPQYQPVCEGKACPCC
jgi:hypothetical protein